MISSQGSQTSDFDVLNSQKRDDDSAVHVIKINKKIGDHKFPKAIQPTELNPVIVDDAEGDSVKSEAASQVTRYSAPKELLDYLDNLIIKKKLPLRTLKFDIEFSKSKDEVAEHLEEHAKKVGNIEKPDLDKMFSILGVDEKDVQLQPEASTEVENENPKNILDIQGSLNALSQQLTHESVPGQILDIKTLRDHYASQRVEYIKKVREDSKVYRIMMSQLGASKMMPERPEPTELIEAREEYFTLRKKLELERQESIKESGFFADSELPNFSIKHQERLKKALAVFDVYENITQVSESIMNADAKSIEKIVDPESFDGMRVSSSEVPIESHEAEPVVEVRKAELDADLVPSEKLLSMDIKTADDKKPNEDVTSKYKTEDVKIEVMGASGINFLPRKDFPVFVVSEQHPEKNKKTDVEVKASVVVQEISESEAKIEEEIKEVTPNIENKEEKKSEEEVKTENVIIEDKKEEKISETVPVDSKVAVTPVSAQNVFPTEFEDKRLEIHHGFPGNPNEIKVFYNGQGIAKGEVGKKITVYKNFKSGFLLADTPEERALKYAHTIIKTLKIQK